ncbi:histidinol dehydrogenase [Microbacterium testaceum]|uniref:histidinol dehydrogenase n=1 Tax=Microbacterium testaceum TaxID=2033 RepID=UPI0009BD4FC3|nr:histidinol dehydrogenase [Microbacterium testaceum]
MNSGILRIVGWAVALLVGAFYGTAGTVAQAFLVGPIPVGLLLATVGSAALLIALRTLTGDRVNALAGGLGITLVTYVFSQVGRGGSAIVAAPTPGTEWVPLVWTVVGPALMVLVAFWPGVSTAPQGTGGETTPDPAVPAR